MLHDVASRDVSLSLSLALFVRGVTPSERGTSVALAWHQRGPSVAPARDLDD